MGELRVLITSMKLSRRSGSELYVWDLATALLDRGHTPIVYSPRLGPLVTDLRARTVPVIDDLAMMSAPPDIIHGQGNHELVTALLHFPDAPAIRVCHGWHESVCTQRFPRIRRFVAVDQTSRDHLLLECGIPAADVRLLLNFADLQRFRPRGPLPSRPTRALVFSNAARQHLWAVRQACVRMGITVDAVGESVGASCARPETILGGYDIVFAKGRCAIEALVTGAAVVLCDVAGAGPMVTSAELDRLRLLNFGLRALRERISPDIIARELARYDPQDAAKVSQRLRPTAGRDAAIAALIELYEEVIAEYRQDGKVDPRGDFRAAASYLQSLTRHAPAYEGYRHPVRALMKLYLRSRRAPGLRALIQYPAVMHLVHTATWKFWR